MNDFYPRFYYLSDTPLPPNLRQLKTGEIVKLGDKYRNPYSGILSEVQLIGHTISDYNTCYYRPITEEIIL